MPIFELPAVEKIEITTLGDNHIDFTSLQKTGTISRAAPFAGGRMDRPIIAEHGFCALIRCQIVLTG